MTHFHFNDTYSLGGGREEAERLALQQRLYQDAKYIDFKATSVVCEVGAGAGANLWVAEQVREGAYIGIDNQLPQILACEARARELHLQNVTFYCADARALPLAGESMQGVFCRLVLIHLPDPDDALSEMYRILRPRGRMIVIEPEVKAYLTTKPALMKCFKARTQFIYRQGHGSIDIALQLPDRCKQLGLTEIEVIQHDIAATGREKETLRQMLMNWALMNKPVSAQLVKEKLVTPDDLSQAERELNELTLDDHVYQRLWIVRGVKAT